MPDFPPYGVAPVADLIPYANNARTHSEAQVAMIAASIREFGFTNPVLVDGKRGIIAGHGRVLAARKLGLAEVPVIELAHLTAAQRKAYILADSRLALHAGWEDDRLRIELGALKSEDFDLGLTGFSDFELDTLLADKTEGRIYPDDAPEPQSVSVPRHVRLLGRHLLPHGKLLSERRLGCGVAVCDSYPSSMPNEGARQ